MWKIYYLFGFENFFIPKHQKTTDQQKKSKCRHERSINSNDSPFLKIKDITSKIRIYSDEDMSTIQKSSLFEYPSPTIEVKSYKISEFDGNKKITPNYFEIAEEIMKELQLKTSSSLEEFELIHEDNSRPENLKIYLKSYLNEEKDRINIYRSEWKIPCSPDIFLKFMNDTPFQITLDSNIMEFMSFDNISTNIFLMYLLYKKLYFVDSRDFVYLKHYKLIEEGKKNWAYISKSISSDKYPEIKGKIRGDILLSGSIIKQLSEKESMVFFYSEINLKINLPVILIKSKTISEMKKYVENFLYYMEKKL